MDPRHPELAIKRVKELISQYERVEADIRKCTVSSKISQLEREGGLVVQEICLVAPRIHEGLMQASRQRRYELSRGIAFGYTPEEKVGKYTKATIGIEEKPVEKVQEIASEGVLEVIEAAKKNAEAKKKTAKKTTKKKTAKKAEK